MHRVFAAIATNDADALVRLGTFTAPSLACAPREVREMPTRERALLTDLLHRLATERAKLSVIAVHTGHQTKMVVRAHAGESCDRIPADSYDVVIDIREEVNGHELRRPTQARLTTIVIDGQWFLTAQFTVPIRLAVYRDDELAQAHDLADRMCACRDTACVSAVDREYETWRARPRPDVPEEFDAQADTQEERDLSELAARAEQCKRAVAP